MHRCLAKSIRFSAVLTLLAAAGASNALAAEGILGNWARGDGNAHVRIAPCGGSVCAINTWVRNSAGGEHVGDRLVMSVTGEGSSLSGTAYDPQRKLNYSLSINYGPQTMQTRGCVLAGIICKSISWTRLSH
jgi:uncharacterized protein (DUF2147 family)